MFVFNLNKWCRSIGSTVFFCACLLNICLLFTLLTPLAADPKSNSLSSEQFKNFKGALDSLYQSAREHDFSGKRKKVEALENSLHSLPKTQQQNALIFLYSELNKHINDVQMSNELIRLIASQRTKENELILIEHLERSVVHPDRPINTAYLELLSGLRPISEDNVNAVFQLTSQLICQDNSSEYTIQNAIAAFQSIKVDEKTLDKLLSCFDRMLRSPNESIQSEIIFKIGQVAEKPSQLYPIAKMLTHKSFDLRMSAAMVLNQSRLIDNVLKMKLFTAMNNTDEKPDIRFELAKALKKYSLSANELAEVNAVLVK